MIFQIRRISCVLMVVTISLFAAATHADALKKPEGGEDVEPEAIIAMYSNKTLTQRYNSGELFRLYLGKDGTFRALDDNPRADWSLGVGTGRWFVTRTGRICHQGRWVYQDANGNQRIYKGFKYCRHVVRDAEKVIWTKGKQDIKWVKQTGKQMAKGYTFQKDFISAYKKIGY